jgi:hypothetical protein
LGGGLGVGGLKAAVVVDDVVQNRPILRVPMLETVKLEVDEHLYKRVHTKLERHLKNRLIYQVSIRRILLVY